MDIKHGVKDLSEKHIETHPLWRYDEDDDLYYPIFSLDEVPDEPYNFFIRAEFTTPTGITLKGHLVSISKNYCIVVFYNSKQFIFNKNLKKECIERSDALISELASPKVKKASDIFPLKYASTINWSGYREVSGEFDAFEKLKSERVTKWKKD